MGFGFAMLAIAIAAFAVTFLGYMGLMGKLPPNNWAGIRTSFTRANDDNWYDTHRASAPVMMFGGILALSTSLAFLPFAFAEMLSPTVCIIVIGTTAAILVGTVLMGWYAGTSFATARAIARAEGGESKEQ